MSYNTQEPRRQKKGIGATAVIILLIVTNIFSVIIGGAYVYYVKGIKGYSAKGNSSTEEGMQKLLTLKQELDENFYFGTDEATEWDYIYKGLFAGLDDPYSYYMSAAEYAASKSNEESYIGIGIQMSNNENGEVLVEKVFSGSPASASGLKAGDVILSADGVTLTGITLSEASSHIKGTQEGSTVKLVVRRGTKTFEVNVARKKINYEYLTYKMLSNKTGYIYIAQFTSGVDSQFASAVSALKKQGATSLVLDLRDNPGGLVNMAVSIADQIMGKTTIISTIDKSQEIVETYSSDQKSIDMKMVVLINGNSASSSEILAGTLKNNEAATVVGTKSYGKGIIQSVFELPDGSAYQYTSMEYILPGNEKIHGVGITPNIEVNLDSKYQDVAVESLDYKNDSQLQKAVELLK